MPLIYRNPPLICRNLNKNTIKFCLMEITCLENPPKTQSNSQNPHFVIIAKSGVTYPSQSSLSPCLFHVFLADHHTHITTTVMRVKISTVKIHHWNIYTHCTNMIHCSHSLVCISPLILTILA